MTEKIITLIAYGSVKLKIKLSLIFGLVFATPFTLIDNLNLWITDNETYVTYMIGVITLDWFFGTIKYIVTKELKFSLKRNIGSTMLKASVVISAMYIFEGVSFFTGEWNFVAGFSETLLRGAIFLYPTMSLMFTWYVLSAGKFPPKRIMEQLEKLK